MAEVKITELPELTTISDADLFVAIDDVAGTPTTKKITRKNAMGGYSHVRATRDSVQSIPNNTLTTVIFDDEEYDTLGEYNATTGVFTATVAGYYTVSGGCSCASAAFTAADFFTVEIIKNSSSAAVGNVDRADATITTNRSSYVTATVHLAIGETVCIKVIHTQGGALNIRDDCGTYEFNYITIDRII